MTMPTFIPSALLCAALLLTVGCGGAEPPRRLATEESTAPAEAATPADETAPETAATEAAPAAESAAPAETPEPTASPEPAGTEVAAAPAADSAPGTGTFKGRVMVDGAAPTFPPVLAKGAVVKDALCSAADIPDESIVVGPDGGLANVFVYLRKVPDGVTVPDAPAEPGVLDQKLCTFIPHATIFRVGQEIRFKNSDPFPHNTHTNPFKNEATNPVVQGNNQEGVPYKYERAETLPVKTNCDIHPWMVSWHLPIDHPWAAVTDANGNFVISNLPPGKLEFRVWQEKVGYVDKGFEVTIAADKTVEKNFTVPAAEFSK